MRVRAGLSLAVVDRAAEVGQVLVQRPAAGHVQHLHAAADREHGQAARYRPPREGQLEAVELGLGRPQLGMLGGAVVVRMQVRPARQADAVEAVEQLVHRAGAHRREDHRHRAGHTHGVEVALAECQLRACGLALWHHVVVLLGAHLRGRHADQRRSRHVITHVSLPPPRWELFTTSAPRSSATRVSPPWIT